MSNNEILNNNVEEPKVVFLCSNGHKVEDASIFDAVCGCMEDIRPLLVEFGLAGLYDAHYQGKMDFRETKDMLSDYAADHMVEYHDAIAAGNSWESAWERVRLDYVFAVLAAQ